MDVMAVIGEDRRAGKGPGRETMARPDRRDGNLKASDVVYSWTTP